MSSIIQGFEYDIFISYRQKDNKGDRWVSEFVEALKIELESTFKEEISVYFDINPHDGLLETHDVDASLKEKLKCLVFIPIISRTYCDPKSFAWEHEFKAFIEQASHDRFGLKIKLPNGNVANRVLPIRIHDLDNEDVKCFEVVTRGVMRTLDFIFKTASGVNRPLKAKEDHPVDNLNKTYYQDQINKVALAIKEIITAIGQPVQPKEEAPKEVFQHKPVQRENRKTKIITGSIIMLVLIVLGYFFITKVFKSEKSIEKSIAVLPFKLISNEPDKQFMADGMMEAITLHLSKIKDLRVMSTESVEQYRSTKKANKTIGQELNVAYLLKGSFQKFGDNVKLIVQLIKTNEDSYKWGNEYKSKWSEIFPLQSEVAQKIVSELNAFISPEEKRLIEKVPTADSTAYTFYLKGREEEGKFPYYDLIISSTIAAGVNQSTKKSVERAEKMYKAALKFDSTFAPAYTGLAGIYWSKNYFREYLSKNFMDSVLFLVKKALSFDDQIPDAYFIMGMYFSEKGMLNQALENFDKTLKLNPNYWLAYYAIGEKNGNALLALENYQEAASRHHGPGLSEIYNKISFRLSNTGFSELAKSFSLKAVELESDSAKYYFWLWMYEFDHKKCFKYYEKRYLLDSTNLNALRFLSEYYEVTGQSKESLDFHKKVLNRLKAEGRLSIINSTQRIGYAYSENGFQDSADYYFNKQIEYCNDAIRLDRSSYSTAYYDLAGVYAFKGDKIKAYKNLRIYNQKPYINLWVRRYIKYDPLFDGIRNEPEFQNIVKDMDAKYQAEHERVRKWLEQQGML